MQTTHHLNLPNNCRKPQIVLTEQDFKSLINGLLVETNDVVIALQNIGLNRLHLHVSNLLYNARKKHYGK